jgi:hypothetical protein
MVAQNSEELTSTPAPSNFATGQVSRARKPRIDRVRALVFWSSALAAAALLAGAAYWSYRHLQPEPLFTQPRSLSLGRQSDDLAKAVSAKSSQPRPSEERGAQMALSRATLAVQVPLA